MISKIRRMCGSEQTTLTLPPDGRSCLSAPSSTPSVIESMNVASLRSITSDTAPPSIASRDRGAQLGRGVEVGLAEHGDDGDDVRRPRSPRPRTSASLDPVLSRHAAHARAACTPSRGDRNARRIRLLSAARFATRRARARPCSSSSARRSRGPWPPRRAVPSCGRAGPSGATRMPPRRPDEMSVRESRDDSRASPWPRALLVHRARRDLLGERLGAPLLLERVLDVLVLARTLRSLLHATWRHDRLLSDVLSGIPSRLYPSSSLRET